jgi:hypothetical protein
MSEERDRVRTDRGRTGDKVPARDPATVPISADAETGGARTDPSAERADGSRRAAIGDRVAGEPISGAARLTQGRGSRPSLLLWSALVGAVVLGAVLAAAGLSSG